MRRLSSLRLASGIGLLGSALVIMGFFLPSRFVTVVFPPNPATFSADSYWSMLNNTVTGGSISLTENELGIGSFVLSILIPLVISLAGLAGFGKRVMLLLSLGFAVLGFLEFLLCIGSSIIAQYLLAKPRPPVMEPPVGLRERM